MSSAGTSVVSNPSQGPNMNQGKEGNAWHEFDILAAVVSRYVNEVSDRYLVVCI
jgi:hypothetical protein